MNSSAGTIGDEAPVVRVTSTTPALADGEVTVQLVVDEQETAAGADPKLAVVDPTTNPVPVTVTTVPPASGPELGEIPLTTAVLTISVKTTEVEPL